MAINTPKPISREEKYLSKIGGNEEVIVPKPISREEKYMYRAAGYDDQPIPDYPIGRNEKYWAKIVENGGGSSTLIEKNITENGVYNASDDEADGYSSVMVDIPEKEIAFSNQPRVFSLSSNIENEMDVIIPNGVTIINDRAFLNCSALKSVIIPDTVTELRQYCFYGCTSITDVNIPDSVIKIESGCFTGCTALKTITIGSGIVRIGAQNFTDCTALETITINKPEGSVSDAPWGAPSTCQIIWTG